MTLCSESVQTLEDGISGSLRSTRQETETYVKAPSERCLNENYDLQGHYYETDIGQYIEYSERIPECSLVKCQTDHSLDFFA